jgi:leader peptidase (prepilin peptidase) / N-methyltransferase
VLIPYFAVALFGLAFGSFLNVCIFRLPRGESIVSPRSHCPHCGHPIRWYDNVPLLSYLILRGRCRDCSRRISPLYPLVEALTSGLLVATFARYGVTPDFVKAAVLGMLLLVLAFTDLFERRIPHPVTLFGTGVGFLLSFFVPVDSRLLDLALHRLGIFIGGPTSSFLGSLSGAFFGGGFFYAVGEIFYRLRGREGIGFGDVMLMLMIGSFLGIPLTLLTILLGSLLGTVVAGTLYLASSRFRNIEWPYGSFLAAAAIFSILGGKAFLDAYLRWWGIA